jgi:hypothetical protein
MPLVNNHVINEMNPGNSRKSIKFKPQKAFLISSDKCYAFTWPFYATELIADSEKNIKK